MTTSRRTALRGRLSRSRLGVTPVQVQMQITPLIDVLLVLLVLGALAWVSGHAARRAALDAIPPADPLPSLSVTLPVKPGHTGSSQAVLTAQSALIGLDAHGQLSWQGRPVTADILKRQLDQALAHDPQAPVWLAIDMTAPYADVVRWLDWLQARQVSQLNLLTAWPASVIPLSGVPRKP